MYTDVIYSDGTSGKVTTSILDKLIKAGEIVAYHCPEWWAESDEGSIGGVREK
jgi:hypothetical protein